jgi:hypothetical protein
MKINLMGADLPHTDRRKDSCDEGNSSVSQFCEGALKCWVEIKSIALPEDEHQYFVYSM